MAQQKTLSVPVLPGMREDLSPHAAPVGTLSNAENVRFPVGGEVEARRGSTALSIATSADVTYAESNVAGNGPDYLEAVPGGFVFGVLGYSYRYDFAKGRVHAVGSYANAVPHGRFAVIAAEEASYTLGNRLPWPLSVAIGGGYVAIVWCGGNGQASIAQAAARIQIFTETGTLVTSFTPTTSVATATWVVYDDVAAAFVLIAQVGTDLSAFVISLAATGATLGASVSLGTLTTGTSYWSACSWTGIGWALIYQSGATTATIKKVSGTNVAATQTFATAGIQPLSIYADSLRVYVGWIDIGADCVAKARVYDTALTLTSGGAITLYTDVGQVTLTLTPPLFGTSVAVAPGGSEFVIGRSTGLTSDTSVQTWILAGLLLQNGALTISFANRVIGAFPASAPFNNGMIWCRMRTPNGSDFGNNYVRNVLLDFMADRLASSDTNILFKKPRVALVGDAFADLFSGDYAGGSFMQALCNPMQKSDGNWIAPLARMVRCEQFTGSISWGLVIGEWLEFQTDAPRQVRTFGQEVIVPGSPVLVGADAVGTLHYGITPTTENQCQGMDLGFTADPSAPVASQTNTADGALTLLGSYQCRSVVEFVDSLGRRWRSAPSRTYSITLTGANDTILHACPDTHAWMRQHSESFLTSGITRHIYRTVAGGSTFYRATPPQGSKLASGDPTGQFVDTMNDGQLATREVLYTDGGVLNNDHPSSCRFVAVMEDRIWLGGLWDQTQIQSSKILVPGEPPQFSDSPAFRVVLPDACSGLAAQDGVLVAFCANAIYAVQGFGPNDQGQGEWGSPRVVTRSTGCVNELSILETSSGIFFQSARGIELLPRGLGEPVFVGAGVQNTLGVNSVVSASVIRTGSSRTARFVIDNAGIGSNVVLVYDLDSNAWSRDTYPMSVSAICDTEQGAVIAQMSVTSGYGFLLETPTLANDSVGSNPQGVVSTVQWTGLHPFGVAGQGRFCSAIGMFDKLTSLSSPGYQTANATLFVTVDSFVDLGKAYDMGAMQQPAYRRHVPLNDTGSACVLKLTTAANGWRFMGWTLELDDMGGGRRMAETEQG